jgi:hypothetical protein
MMFPILLLVVLAVACAATFVWAKRHPDLQRKFRPALPYLYILTAALTGYLGFTAYERRAWWSVPTLYFLTMAVIEVVRQRRISRAGH